VLPNEFHDVFEAIAEVAGTLIGLLFVAISVAGERVTGEQDEAQGHRVRASAALSAFSNSLTIALFALVPGIGPGFTAFVLAILGLLFVAGSLLSLLRVRKTQEGQLRDGLFLVALAAIFAIQLVAGLAAHDHPSRRGPDQTLAILAIVCFVFGIARAWELIGGPSVGLGHELGLRIRRRADVLEAEREDEDRKTG
jgi:hypothetical protein